MTTQRASRRGNASQLAAFTGAEAEMSINTTTWTAQVHDGVTAGGHELVGISATQTLTNKTLVNPVFTGTTTMDGLVVDGEAVLGNGTDGLKSSWSTGNSTGIIDTAYTSTGIEIRTGNVQRMLIDSTGIDVTGTATMDGLVVGDGIQLGGTGAANKLDDYEEGTWTPALGGGATATNMTGTYTKVGRLVTATLSLMSSTISGSATYQITGLPFTCGGTRAAFPVVYHSAFNITCESISGIVPASSAQMELLGNVKNASWLTAVPQAGSGRYIHATVSYQTA